MPSLRSLKHNVSRYKETWDGMSSVFNGIVPIRAVDEYFKATDQICYFDVGFSLIRTASYNQPRDTSCFGDFNSGPEFSSLEMRKQQWNP